MSTSKAPPTSGPKAIMLASIQMTRPVKVRTSWAIATQTTPSKRSAAVTPRAVLFIGSMLSRDHVPVKNPRPWRGHRAGATLLAAEGRVEDVAEPVAGAADHGGGDHE